MINQKKNNGSAIVAVVFFFLSFILSEFFKEIIAGSWREFFYKQTYISFENAEWVVLHVFGYLEAVKIKLSGNVFGFLWNQVVFSYTIIILVIALLMAMLLAYMAIQYSRNKDKTHIFSSSLAKERFFNIDEMKKREQNMMFRISYGVASFGFLCLFAAYSGWFSDRVRHTEKFDSLVNILQHNTTPNTLFLFFGLFFVVLSIALYTSTKKTKISFSKFKRILVLSQSYTCRSIMAETLIDQLGHEQFFATVGAFSPAETIDPLTIKTLEASGMVIGKYANNQLSSPNLRAEKNVKRLAGQYFDLIISLDDETARQPLPQFIGPAQRVYWNIAKPTAEAGQAAYDETYNLLGREVEQLLKNNPVI